MDYKIIFLLKILPIKLTNNTAQSIWFEPALQIEYTIIKSKVTYYQFRFMIKTFFEHICLIKFEIQKKLNNSLILFATWITVSHELELWYIHKNVNNWDWDWVVREAAVLHHRKRQSFIWSTQPKWSQSPSTWDGPKFGCLLYWLSLTFVEALHTNRIKPKLGKHIICYPGTYQIYKSLTNLN